MKKMRLFTLMIAVCTFCTLSISKSQAQVNIATGQTITQNFNAIGVDAAATLPTGWKVDKSADVRTVGTYSAALTETERLGGNNLGSNATNGIYNFGAGDPATAQDRAIGWISSSTATKSGNLYVKLQNNGSTAINYLTLSYDVEKYRKGTRAEGFSIQMYYSTDGTTWTDAGANFLTSFPGADAANEGYAQAPGETMSVTNKDLNVAIAPAGSLYLAWNYSVTSGTFTSNAQALAVDNVSIAAAAASTANDATLSSITSSMGVLMPSFSPATLAYTIELPFGTTATPTITATPSNAQASVTVTPATDVTSATPADRTTTIVVISQDQTETKTYTVVFNVPANASNDATLSAITVSQGNLSPAFSASVMYYTVQLPFGTTTVPTVTATTTHPFAVATVTPATDITSTDSLDRTTVISIVAEDGTTTETYKVQFNVAVITAIDVADIAALRAGLTDGTLYRLTGEAIFTYKQSYRNQKFIQDATAAIMIDDFSAVLDSTINIGDGITNLIGELTVYNNMLQFKPITNPGTSSINNVVVSHIKTTAQIVPDDQAKLLKILNATFPSGTANFATNTNYTLTDAAGTIVFRTNFHEADYIGIPVPQYNADVVGIYIQYLNTKQITSRFTTDIQQSTNVNDLTQGFVFEAYPNPSAKDVNFAFDINDIQEVTLNIYDATGKLLFNYTNNLSAGNHIVTWENAGQMPHGVYFYSFITNNNVKQGKLVITK